MRTHPQSPLKDTEADAVFQYFIKKEISPRKAAYLYEHEKANYNPAFENISEEDFYCPLRRNEKRIFSLRGDFILATGMKNVSSRLGNKPFEIYPDYIQNSLETYLDVNDRYGHPSLAMAEGEYDGSVFYGGWLAKRDGYLQVYLISGRFNQQLSEEQQTLIESYIAKKLIEAYGDQRIRYYDFAHGFIINELLEQRRFFHDQDLDKPYREYDKSMIDGLTKTLISKQKKEIALKQKKAYQESLLTSQKKAELEIVLKPFKDQLMLLLERLLFLHERLDEKAKNNPEYSRVAQSVDKIASIMKQQMDIFDHPTPAGFKIFHAECSKMMKNAKKEAEKHRGWHQINPILRAILGVCAAITVLPALMIEIKSKQGYMKTFFETPCTNTKKELSRINKKFNAQTTEVNQMIAGFL